MMVAPLVYAAGVGAFRVAVWAGPRLAPLFMTQAARQIARRAAARVVARSQACATCCPPCQPPVGSIQYEIHRVPPGTPHAPCTGDHMHFFVMQQSPPPACQCFAPKQKEAECLSQGQNPDVSGMHPSPNQAAKGP